MGCCGKGPYDEVELKLKSIEKKLDKLEGYTVSMEEIDVLRARAAVLLEKRNKTPIPTMRRTIQRQYDKLYPQIEEKLRIYREEHNL